MHRFTKPNNRNIHADLRTLSPQPLPSTNYQPRQLLSSALDRTCISQQIFFFHHDGSATICCLLGLGDGVAALYGLRCDLGRSQPRRQACSGVLVGFRSQLLDGMYHAHVYIAALLGFSEAGHFSKKTTNKAPAT